MQLPKLMLTALLAATLQACSDGSGGSAESLADNTAAPSPIDKVIKVGNGDDHKRTLVVVQEPPFLMHVDIGQDGGSHGDVLVYDAKFTSTKDLPGRLSGMITTIDIPDPGEVIHDRIAQIVFDFSGVGTLVVGGKATYPFDGSGTDEMIINSTQIRPVVGGTGDFLGALGQVSTTRNEDLSYKHEFQLVGITQWTEPSSASTEQTTLTLYQEPPNILHVDLGQDGRSRGDLLAVDTQFTSTQGLSGKLSAIITTIDIPDQGEGGFQDRFFKGAFDFGEANTLVVFGKSDYPADSSSTDELAFNMPLVKPVVGGTGKFMGARGQVTTTRKKDGTYKQEFQLVGIKNASQPIPGQQKTLTFRQALPNLVHVDVGLEGGSHGDILAFDADVTSTEGLSGKLSGMITTVYIPGPDDLGFKDRIVHMVFDLGSANSLVVAGKSLYPFDGSATSVFEKNVPQVRAIIGGTNEYFAARGQLVTTRNEDGTYTHELQFADLAYGESIDW